MNTVSRISRGIQNPEEIKPFLNRYKKSTGKLLRDKRLAKLPLLIEHALGTEFLIDYLSIDSEYGDIIETDVFGNQMWVFATDRGISRDLLIHGVREEKSTKAFIDTLKGINKILDDVTILEIGANIGYYVLLEATTISSGHIYAIEPEYNNFGLLNRNVMYNDFSEYVTTRQAVIGETDGSAELELSDQSNTHQVHTGGKQNDSEIVSVDSYTVDSFMNAQNLSPEDINVVRMDIEGYETEVIEQLETILTSGDETVLFVELHHRLIGEEEYEHILNFLSASGFEPVSAVYNTKPMPSWDGKEMSAECMMDLRQVPEDANCVELIAHRKIS